MANMLKIYGIKNCNSMKKAFDLLTELGLSYEFHDYKKQGIDADTIKVWLNALGQDVVLNKKGTTWRKLTEEQQQTALSSEDALIAALSTHTSLIKRPILATPTGFIAGFDDAAYRTRTQVWLRPNAATPIKPRSSSFLPPSASWPFSL